MVWSCGRSEWWQSLVQPLSNTTEWQYSKVEKPRFTNWSWGRSVMSHPPSKETREGKRWSPIRKPVAKFNCAKRRKIGQFKSVIIWEGPVFHLNCCEFGTVRNTENAIQWSTLHYLVFIRASCKTLSSNLNTLQFTQIVNLEQSSISKTVILDDDLDQIIATA